MKDAFVEEMVSVLPKFRLYLLKVCRSEDTMEDLVQSACEKALSNRDKFIPGTSMIAWLATIGLNLFRSEKRRSWRSQELSDEIASRLVEKPIGSLRLELEEALEALSLLSPSQQRVIILDTQDISMDDIAEIMKIPAGTVKSQLSRGRQQLKRIYDGG